MQPDIRAPSARWRYRPAIIGAVLIGSAAYLVTQIADGGLLAQGRWGALIGGALGQGIGLAALVAAGVWIRNAASAR